MKGVEFYNFESEVWYRKPTGECVKLTEDSSEAIHYLYDIICEQYPGAFTALDKHFSKLSYDIKFKRFRMVNLFCKCNFGTIDQSRLDISPKGTFAFEHVSCPMRGECPMEDVVCHPKFNSRISDSELRVLELVYKGMEKEEIADILCLSHHTVGNHIRNAYTRLGIHEKAEFIRYAQNHNLFKEQ